MFGDIAYLHKCSVLHFSHLPHHAPIPIYIKNHFIYQWSQNGQEFDLPQVRALAALCGKMAALSAEKISL